MTTDDKFGLTGIIPSAGALAALQQGSVTTSPLKDENITPEVAALQETPSAASGSGGIAASGGPLPQGSTESQPGAAGPKTPPANLGSTDEFIHTQMRTNAEGLADVGEQAAKRANGQNLSKAQQTQLQEVMNQLGAMPSIEKLESEIYDELRQAEDAKKITKKQHTKLKDRWKNIFNIIDEDEMGLFLIDFGMRAMMAGETMGSIGAIGAAGSGAMQALQGRRQLETEQDAALRTEASDRALGQFRAQSERISAISALERARAAGVRADAAGAGYQGEKAFLLDFFRSVGWSDDEVADYFAKAKGDKARRQELTDALNKRIANAEFMDTDPVSGKKYRDFGPTDIKNWVDRMLAVEGADGALGGDKSPDDYYDETE